MACWNRSGRERLLTDGIVVDETEHDGNIHRRSTVASALLTSSTTSRWPMASMRLFKDDDDDEDAEDNEDGAFDS